jgi:hypothetical protein
MSASGRAAARAASAADSDLTGDASADPSGIDSPCVFDYSDELVPGDAREPGVAAQQLEIGAADAGREHADDAFIGGHRL